MKQYWPEYIDIYIYIPYIYLNLVNTLRQVQNCHEFCKHRFGDDSRPLTFFYFLTTWYLHLTHHLILSFSVKNIIHCVLKQALIELKIFSFAQNSLLYTLHFTQLYFHVDLHFTISVSDQGTEFLLEIILVCSVYDDFLFVELLQSVFNITNFVITTIYIYIYLLPFVKVIFIFL